MMAVTLPGQEREPTAPSILTVKYVVLVPDGCADEPLEELDGRTPLEAAAMPAMARLAAPGALPHRARADRGGGDGHRARPR